MNSQCTYKFITINNLSFFINNNNSIGITIKSNSNISTCFNNFLSQKFRRSCTTVSIDIKTIW